MELPADLFTELAERARFEPAPVAAGRGDHRASLRVQIAMDASVVRLGAGPKVKPMAVTIRDLSVRGVGFECSETFRVTEAFALRLTRSDGSVVWLQCDVTRWMPMAQDRFWIGANFHKMLATPTKPTPALAGAAA